MATRRSRLQIKPNIGGKSNVDRTKGTVRTNELSLTQKPGSNVNEQENSERISPEQALGAVKAFPVQVDNQREHGTVKNGEKGSVKKTGGNQPFTRLKRFGLSLDSPTSKSDEKDKNDSHRSQHEKVQKPKDDTQEKSKKDAISLSVKAGKTFTRRFSSNVPKASLKVTSPLTSPTATKNCGSDPLQSVKSSCVSPLQSKEQSPKSMVPTPGKRALHIGPRDNGPSVVKSPKKQSRPRANSPADTTMHSTVSPKPVTMIKSPVMRSFVAEPLGGSTKRNDLYSSVKEKQQSSEESNKVVHSSTELRSGSIGTDTIDGRSGPESKSSSVIQRLPFRSRFPKAKPNIEALKLKSKGLTLPREENLSRPSSPLKSPKLGKGASPMKMFQPNHRSSETTDDDRGQKPGRYDNLFDTGSTTEGRKRHISTSSVSTVHSEAPPPLKNPSDKNSMTIGDLIYYNPVKNSMSSTCTQKKKAKLEKEKEKENIETVKNTPTNDPENSPPEEPEDEEDMPVPQVKIGPDGSIIINEESLIIRRPEEAPITEIIEEAESTATYTSFIKKPLSRTAWSQWDTEKFYRALSYLGTDFSLMIKLFPNRTRYDIKTKFKREDKFNRSKVEYALKNKKPFDMSFFEREAELDKQEEKRKKKESEEKIKKAKLQRLEKKKEKITKTKVESEPVERRRGTRERKSRKTIYDEDEDEDSLDTVNIPVTPVKTPVSFSPYKRNDSAPFVPPFCLSQEEDTDKDSLEEQVTMSDSEILSPQRPQKSQVTPRPDEPITINPADFPPNTNIQITQDSNNSPLVLVYHTTEDGKGDTVIHVYQLQNQTNIQNSSANSEQADISEQSNQPIGDGDTSEQGSLPFLIAEQTTDNVTQNNCDDFINVIDINASKIATPQKGSEEKGQSSSDSDQPLYQVVAVNPNDESQNIAIENEFRPSGDKKFLDINVLSKNVGCRKSLKKS